MPSPITSADFASAEPLANSDLCTRLSRFFDIPRMLKVLTAWMFTPSGSLSDEFNAEVGASITPVGSAIFSFSPSAGSFYLLADGTEVSRTTYPALFAAIGTLFGAGDGVTTFGLPDMRGRVPIGAGTGAGLTNRDINVKYVGTETHTMTVAEMPAHTHAVASSMAGRIDGGDGGEILNIPEPGGNPALSPATTTVTAGGGAAFAIMQPSIIGYWFIRAF